MSRLASASAIRHGLDEPTIWGQPRPAAPVSHPHLHHMADWVRDHLHLRRAA